jgi:hypothetical protein
MGTVQKINSFGVGSFVFKVVSEKICKTETHISALHEELRKIPGIENVSIQPDARVYEHIIPYNDEVVLSFLDIEFEIDLSAGDFCEEGKNKFRFVSRNQFDSVITTIFPYFETENPSSGIIRVREHIRSFLNYPYTLEVTGPSPFHADFFINKTNFFGVDIKKTRGYDIIEVHVSSTSDSDVIEEIYENLAGEFDLFYLIRTVEVKRQEFWNELKELVSKVLHTPNFLSLSIQDQFPFRRNYLLTAMGSLAEFEAESLSCNQLINERFTNTYNIERNFLRSYIEEEKKSVYEYPIESTKNLLKFIADSRGRTRGTINTYVNTVVNIILGFGVAVALYFLGIK